MARRTADEWRRGAVEVVRAMLDEHGAVTTSEMEARASDRTYDPHIFPAKIDPHHFVDARQAMQGVEGVEIVSTTERTRSGRAVTTWSSINNHGKKAVGRVAGRKRLLTDRHAGWGQRGGGGHGLLGAAGEGAMVKAYREAEIYAGIQHSTTSILGIDVTDLGEVDIVCGLYDTSNPNDPAAITVMTEVKNTRSWYYGSTVHNDDGELRKFLRKAAWVQAARPDALICPVFVLRQAQYTLIVAGKEYGFLTASVQSQSVLRDHDISREPTHFDEVRDELGYADLRLVTDAETSTPFHRGIATKHIPKNARATARLWRVTHAQFLDDDPELF